MPDVILCAWPTIELGLESVRYGKARGVPVVLDIRDLWPDLFLDAAPRLLRPLARMALHPYFVATRVAFANCSALIGVSEGYLKWGLRKAGRDKTDSDAVFELGYQQPEFSESELVGAKDSLLRFGVDETRTICWFLGTFGDTYDLRPVIDGARTLKATGNSAVQIVLSGDGDRRRYWEGIASGLDNVIFTGWLSGPQIQSMMRMASVGIAAYKKDAPQGLPNKLFEYMAAGIPILSCLSGECTTFLRANSCGLSYEAGNAESYLAGLTALTANKDYRRQLGHNALCAFNQRYSAPMLYGQLVDHLELIAGVRNNTPTAAVLSLGLG